MTMLFDPEENWGHEIKFQPSRQSSASPQSVVSCVLYLQRFLCQFLPFFRKLAEFHGAKA